MNISNPNTNSAPLPWHVSLALLDLVVGHKHTRRSRMSWSASSGMGLCALVLSVFFSCGMLRNAAECCGVPCRLSPEHSISNGTLNTTPWDYRGIRGMFTVTSRRRPHEPNPYANTACFCVLKQRTQTQHAVGMLSISELLRR